MTLLWSLRWSSAVLIVASTVLSNCNSGPSATPSRPIDGMCVPHADVFGVNTISLNHKVFTAVRDSTSSSTGFSDFRRVNGPFGDSTLSTSNLDSLPSVYAISETWFRGVAFNESVRAQVIPALRTNGNGQPLVGEPGTGTAFSPPIDVLSASGDGTSGTVRDMLITASLCPERGNRSPTLAQVNDEIVLTWNEPDTKSILVREVVSSPRTWVTGRPASVYSPLMRAEPDGLAIRDSKGNEVATTALRTRISLRPYSDMPP